VAIAAVLRAAGVPDTSVDNGWEYNMLVELKYANHINYREIELPTHAYVPTPPAPPGTCVAWWYDETPHIKPRYTVAFNSDKCYGPAPFAPVYYSQWLASRPGVLYVVNSIALSKR